MGERDRLGKGGNVLNMFRTVEDELLKAAIGHLRNRIRKDTRVTVHLRGRKDEVKTFSYIFGTYSSFLHRLITFMLYRCGAFGLDFSPLNDAVARHSVPAENVLCRYGADTMAHLRALFVDAAFIRPDWKKSN